MGALVSEEASQQILHAQSMLANRGAKTLVSCEALPDNSCILTPGLLVVTPDYHDDEEYFGPLATLCFVKDMTHAIKIANRTRYGLAAGLLSDDRKCYEHFLHNIRAGIVNWNSPTTGASGKLPFGGIGSSGNHRPSGYFASDYCSYPIASVEKNQLQLLPMSPGLEAIL
jgi:succinylglutamic semialdehyde dehydrogenase